MIVDPRRDFEEALQFKKDGGVPLDVIVSSGVWIGGILDAWPHDPFVAVGPRDWDSGTELTYFSSREEIRAFIARLRMRPRRLGPRLPMRSDGERSSRRGEPAGVRGVVRGRAALAAFEADNVEVCQLGPELSVRKETNCVVVHLNALRPWVPNSCAGGRVHVARPRTKRS